MVKLVIFSDPICPWCYIGKSRLERALEARPDHPFELEWHPFMLNPDMPPEGMERRAYLEAKFGGQEGAVRAYLPVSEEAAKAGLELNLGAIPRTPNTLDAQRLIHWAGLDGRQTRVAGALFRAYFVEGRDLSRAETLAEIGEGAGMDGALIRRLLATEADADDIRARDADARHKGVRAVPTFVIANHYVVEGTQPTDLWLRVIDEIAAQGSVLGEEIPAGPEC